MSEPIERLRTFLEVLKAPFVGRDEEAKVVVLTLLAREHCVFIGEPGCVLGNTVVSDAEGRLYHIDDIAMELPAGVYPTNLPVFPPANATQLHIYEVGNVVRVSTRLGFSLNVTPNHPIMTDRGWVRAEDLMPGDRALIYLKLPSPSVVVMIPVKEIVRDDESLSDLRDLESVPLDESLSELLGILFTKGRCGNGYVELEVGRGDDYLISHVKDLIRKTLGREALSPSSEVAYECQGGVKEFIRLGNKSLYNLFKLLVHEDRLRNRVPKPILKSPKDISAAFLRGLFETCGELRKMEWGAGDAYVVLRGFNADLLREVQVLLLRHGVVSRVRETSNNLDGGLGSEGVLEIHGLDNVVSFHNEVGFISEVKNEAVKSLIKLLYDGASNRERIVGENNFMFDPIDGVEVVHGAFRVYDFHVPTTHAFFTNGLLSHNTAKSALVRRAAELLDAKFFKYLLTRFTEPAEIFGPLDIRALNEGKYVRITHGKLPEADIAFLDEIFKANSAILNSLNTLLQERVLYDGYNEIKVPLWSLFGASNEVPEEPETEAFYDRFTLRHFVKPVSEDMWYDLLDKSWDLEVKSSFMNNSGSEYKVMSINHLRDLHQTVLNVDIGSVKSKFVKLLAVLEGRGIHVTDRRKGKALKIIASHAMLNGRATATEDDLIVIKYVVPRDLEELDKVNTVLSEELKTPYKYLRELNEVKVNVKEILNYVTSLRNVESRFVEMRFREIYRDLEITKERVISLMIESGNKEVEKAANEVVGLIEAAMEVIRGRIS